MKMKIMFLSMIGGLLISTSSVVAAKDSQSGEDPNLKRTPKSSKTEAVSGVSNYTGGVSNVTGRKYQENLPKPEKEKSYKKSNK